MENIDVQAVYCRVCGTKCKEAVKIFSGKGRGMGLYEKILKCLLLSVKKNDQLPTRVCYTCIDRLDEFSQFNLLARQAQVKLRTLLKVQGVHVKDEKSSELISTWKALMAMQEKDCDRGLSKGRKRKRKHAVRLDISSNSETSDSSSDSEPLFQARHAIMPSSGVGDFSTIDSSVNHVKGITSTPKSIFPNSNDCKQEENLMPSASLVSISNPPKEGLSFPNHSESSQIMPVSTNVMVPFQQQPSSVVDNNFVSTPTSQPLLMPNKIQNPIFLCNSPLNVGIPPVYLMNLAFSSSETEQEKSNFGETSQKHAPPTSMATTKESYSSFITPVLSQSTLKSPQPDQNVFKLPTAPSTQNPSSLFRGNSSSNVQQPSCSIDPFPKSQISGDPSNETQLNQPQTNSQESAKETYSGHFGTDYSQIPSRIITSDDKSLSKNNPSSIANINSDNISLPSLSCNIESLSVKHSEGRVNFQYSDISDVEESVKEKVDIKNDNFEGNKFLSQNVTKEGTPTSSIPKVTFKIVPQTKYHGRKSSLSPLNSIKVARNKEKSLPSSYSTVKFSALDSEKGIMPGSSSLDSMETPQSSDDVKSLASSCKEKQACETHKNINDAEISKEDSKILEEDLREDCLKIVSDTESGNISLEEVRKDLISQAENSLLESNTNLGSDFEKTSQRSTPSVVDEVPKKSLVSSDGTNPLPVNSIEAPVTHYPDEINTQASSKANDEKDVTKLKKELSKERLKTHQTSTPVQNQSNLKPAQDMAAFRCKLCSDDNPKFFNDLKEAMFHHQQCHHGISCSFVCTKCNFVSGQLQHLEQHVLSSCSSDQNPTSATAVENVIPKIKQENSQDYELALLNLKNALRSVSMPRFRKLLTSCKAVMSPDGSAKEVNSDSSFNVSSPSPQRSKKEAVPRTNDETSQLCCYFCYLRFNTKAELMVHSKNCPSPDRSTHLLDSPPTKKFKSGELFNSSLFTKEGSYYSCIQCGKHYSSVFKAKMHATKSKSCRKTTQTSFKGKEFKWKTPDANLPSTFRSEHCKRQQKEQSSTAQSTEATTSYDSCLNSDMVFDIPRIKVEKEDSMEEVLDVESYEDQVKFTDSVILSEVGEKENNQIRDERTNPDGDNANLVGSGRKTSHDACSSKAQNFQSGDEGFDLGKVKSEVNEAPVENNSEIKVKSMINEVIQSGLEKNTSTSPKTSFINSKVDFNQRIVRKFSTPFQVIRPEEDPKEPVVVMKGVMNDTPKGKKRHLTKSTTSPKKPPVKCLTPSMKNIFFAGDIPSPIPCTSQVTRPTVKPSSASSIPEAKESPVLTFSSSKIAKRTYFILPKPTLIPFTCKKINESSQASNQIPIIPNVLKPDDSGEPPKKVIKSEQISGASIKPSLPLPPLKTSSEPLESTPSPPKKSPVECSIPSVNADISTPDIQLPVPSTSKVIRSIIKPSSASSTPETKISSVLTHSSSKIVKKTCFILPKPTIIPVTHNEANEPSQISNQISMIPNVSKPDKELSKEAIKKESTSEKIIKTSLPLTPPRTSPESLDSSPSKMWLKNAEKFCMKKKDDPNRGLVLKVPLIKLTRLRLLNNGEVDVSGIDFGNVKNQQTASSTSTSIKNDSPAKEGNNIKRAEISGIKKESN